MKLNWVSVGAVSAALAIMLGAFGSHTLKSSLDSYALDIWKTAAQYHLPHAIGLMIIGVIQQHGARSKTTNIAAILLFLGQILFCGSLYLLAASGTRWLGIITPAGGLCLIAGWLLTAYSTSRNTRTD